jgi:pyridoxamine 5'-phosphate oxidase
MDNPIIKFQQWWQEALANSPLNQKSAVCVSTIDEHGFPSARFVDLKSANETGFTFCTYIDSAKGKHLRRNPNTAITIWWDHVSYQVRIVGVAELIEEAEAERIWKTRNRSAQLTTTAFEQSQILANEEQLNSRLAQATSEFAEQEIPKPEHWGGYCVKPVSIEFLTFRESRLHLRELYERKGDSWIKHLLQP